ncbi:hypothetical protein GCM10009555_018340 [Acrocarpospora macrocephala]|uniref:Uncharacterized protein n=1 Tax=Acrocarpospora macrocephala TaxID=150177 RepID=A0A5M3WET5_9ACTN|nr:hypothetical protein [Acrocarpospora macrocephala]GES07494.1 hypothetical protein Amac_010890 [Acrocarpospora macrocephala]
MTILPDAEATATPPVLIASATPAQIWAHVTTCSACTRDRLVRYHAGRRMLETDAAERQRLEAGLRERVGELHGQSIPVPGVEPALDLIAAAHWSDLQDAIEAAGFALLIQGPSAHRQHWIISISEGQGGRLAEGVTKHAALVELARDIPSVPGFLAALAEGRSSEAQSIVDALVEYAAQTNSSTSDARGALVAALHVGQGHTASEAADLAERGYDALAEADVLCDHDACVSEARDLADDLIERSRRAALTAIDDAREADADLGDQTVPAVRDRSHLHPRQQAALVRLDEMFAAREAEVSAR